MKIVVNNVTPKDRDIRAAGLQWKEDREEKDRIKYQKKKNKSNGGKLA